jgi:hypothetical protein
MTNYDFVARGSAWIQRAPENGKDGVGITSADVVFAQSKSSTNPPADTDVWKTNVKELSLVDGYLWSGTKIVYSNKDIAITGKYCIGSTRDFTDIEELYYLSDSGDKIPTNVTFQSSFKPEKGKYLWTCIRYRFKAPSGSAENTNWVYSTPTCAGYFGDDGVSVQSSDVVFAIGESRTTAPATGWITNFVGLTLAEGKYVWTCTKTTLTDGDSYYTGAYCLGECYDFAQVEELYALSDSSTNPPDDEFFSSSYKVVKGKYLWSCVKVTYNDANISYLNRTCVNYFPNDGVNGTKFTPKGTAYGHYTASSKMPKPSDDVLGLLYLVDKVDTTLKPINSPCVAWWRSISAGSYILAYDAAEEGDAYNVDGTLWVHNGTVWKDFGSIQGPKGDDGEDALNIDLSTDRLIFDYNRPNFNPSSGSVAIVARHGNTVIDPSEYSVKIISTKNYDAKKASIATSGKSYNLIFKADGISMITYSPPQAIEESNNIEYPASSCNVKLAISYNGITYTKTIFMDVSFAQTYGDLKWNTERLYGEFGEFKTDVAGKFTQTASAISLKADAATLSNFKNEYDKNGELVNKRIGNIEVKYDEISLTVSSTEKGLRDTGINITNKKIVVTANNFEIQNNGGDPTFTIDENGNLISSGDASFKGKITATSGYIGGLEIYNDTYQFGGQTFKYKGLIYQNMEYDGYMPNHSINLNDRYLYVGYGDSGFGGVFIAGYSQSQTSTLGGQTEFNLGAFLTVRSHTDNSATMQSSTAGRFTASSNKDGIATVLEANAYGGKENYAVDALNGDIRVQNGDIRAESGDFIADKGTFVGVHRGNVKKTGNSNYTLKKTDSTIVCNNTAKDISITMPSDAVAGTFYRIIKRGKTVTFQSSKKDISLVNNIDLLSSVSSGTAREWINCLWDGECWLMEMSRS